MIQRQPKPEHLQRLSKITNPVQKKALLLAIEQGDEIPEYAWTPITDDVYRTEEDAIRFSVDAQNRFNRSLAEKVLDELPPVIKEASAVANHESLYLCKPIVNKCEMLDLASASNFFAEIFTTLCEWGYFNPCGPTIVTLSLVKMPGFREGLLFLQVKHPMSPSHAVVGLIPNEVSKDGVRLTSTLDRLFDQGGSADFPILRSEPTYIVLSNGSPLNAEQQKLIFRRAICNIESEDWEADCEHILHYKGDPWGRATAELHDSFGKLEHLLKREGVKDFGELIEKQKQLGIDIYGEWRKSRKPSKPTSDQFDRWWSIVTDFDHVRAETREMPKAWEGSKKFMFGPK